MTTHEDTTVILIDALMATAAVVRERINFGNSVLARPIQEALKDLRSNTDLRKLLWLD